MINKLEVGKTYRLVDKHTYLTRLGKCNAETYSRYFKDEMVTVDNIRNGNGFVKGYEGASVISMSEYEMFEVVEDYESLQQINSPFGELDKQTKKDLLCAWVDGAGIEYRNFIGTWVKVTCVGDIEFYQNTTYRVKPTISAKDAAKAKLISEAQQQLRDAQEALDKAQQL